MEVRMTDMCGETFLGADAYVEEFSHLNSKDNTIELIIPYYKFKDSQLSPNRPLYRTDSSLERTRLTIISKNCLSHVAYARRAVQLFL